MARTSTEARCGICPRLREIARGIDEVIIGARTTRLSEREKQEKDMETPVQIYYLKTTKFCRTTHVWFFLLKVVVMMWGNVVQVSIKF
jgi:hypothetical protein